MEPPEGPVPRTNGLPKVYKPDVPLRPVIASTTALNYQLAKYIFHLSRPGLPQDQDDTRSPAGFPEQVEDPKLEAYKVVVPFDVRLLHKYSKARFRTSTRTTAKNKDNESEVEKKKRLCGSFTQSLDHCDPRFWTVNGLEFDHFFRLSRCRFLSMIIDLSL